jgi:penicillin-insensitive murein DD-endopeptidase
MFQLWERARTPSPGSPEPMGAYSAGCLAGAVPLNLNGTGYAVMRPSRLRNFAHPSMVEYLNILSQDLHSKKMPLLLVGDIGRPRGGPMASGHASHQIGLDVDLWLRMSKTRPNKSARENWSAPSFVIGRKKLKSTWSQTQTDLVATAADLDGVNRIFVSPPIKKYFCEKMPTARWLYKLRAWWGHEEHIHVRLNCPSDSSTCVPQAPLNSADNGCGSELDWWFSAEADADWKKLQDDKSERQFPELPPACSDLVKDLPLTQNVRLHHKKIARLERKKPAKGLSRL